MSSIRAPFRLRLTAAQTGVDPRTHYWFKAGKNDYRRLCDNTPWVRKHRISTFYDVCGRCHGMRQDDREHGFRAFSLTHRQTGVFAYDSEDTYVLDGSMMRAVPMETFVKFCARDKAGREKYFADKKRRRQQRKNRARLGGPHPYLHLKKHLDKYHWQTGNIDQLDINDPALALASHDMSKSRNQKKLATYRVLQEKYVAEWRTHQAGYFPVGSVVVWVGGYLPIEVDPEIGMQPGVPENALPWILKLWFLDEVLGPRTIQACIFLLGEARRIGRWNSTAQLGVWDVRNAEFKIMGLPDYIEDLVHGAADEYLALRKSYDLP